jgi:signal transduction histidine kinase
MPGPASRHVSWPLLLLLACLAAIGAAGWQAQRASRLQRLTAEQLLHDYAAFAAWTFRQEVNDVLREAAWQVLNPILHRDVHMLQARPGAGHLIEYQRRSLAECGCDPAYRVGTYFAFVLGDTVLEADGAPFGERGRRAVLDSHARRIREPDAPPERMALVAEAGGLPLLAYGLMPTFRNDTVVYGFTLDPASLPAVFDQAFSRQPLLPSAVTRGAPNDSLLDVRVLTRSGRVLFSTAAEVAGRFAVEDTVPAAAAALRVSAAPKEALIRQAMGSGMPHSAFLGVLILIAAALAVVAVRQLRREEELAQVRSDFVSSVSHELRTPLAQVRLFLETLRLRRFSTEEQREWLLDHLDRETTRLTQLVENVLHFSRSDRRQTPPPLEPRDLGAEIEETVRAFAPLAAVKQVELRTELAPGLVAPVDSAAFRQLLLNLLDNAVKYGPPGQAVTVSAAREGNAVRLSVSDEGPGVPASERDRVWEPFYRGRANGARAVGGSGIGLAVVRDAVDRHGGRVWLEDRAPAGMRVVMELPA